MKTFPMFLQMQGRRVLILGGGEQAAQKVRLILKTEAEIVVLADSLNTELQTYVDENRITHLNEPLTPQLLRSAILTFSATGCDETGASHAALAKAANALINVVDMPEYCDAMTPSIVDRDPLVIAIGTEGNAPILGRQIKSKIETTLETKLGDLVAFAGRMRADVARNIPEPKRRAFWKTVFDGPVRNEFRQGNERRAFSMIKDMITTQNPCKTKGCTLSVIKSEHGLAGKLRLEDVAKLQEADKIFFKRGLHENILEMARRDAQREGYDRAPKDMETLQSDHTLKDMNVVVISATASLCETPAPHGRATLTNQPPTIADSSH